MPRLVDPASTTSPSRLIFTNELAVISEYNKPKGLISISGLESLSVILNYKKKIKILLY